MTSSANPVEALVMRMQGEFLDTPHLRLTMPQAERRFGVDRVTCEAVLGVLVEAKVLARSVDGSYHRFFPRLRLAA